MATENAKADPTYMGYYFMGFVLLVLAVFGLEIAGVFGDMFPLNSSSQDVLYGLPIFPAMIMLFAFVAAIIMGLFAVFSYKAGKKASTACFVVFMIPLMVLGVIYIVIQVLYFMAPKVEQLLFLYPLEFLIVSGWFIWIVVAVLFGILAMYMFIDGQSKLVGILAVILAVAFLFFALGIMCGQSQNSFGADFDASGLKMMSMVFGIFMLIAAVVAAYLGFAHSVPRARLPVF